MDHIPSAGNALRSSGKDFYFTHCSDGRKRLSPEAKRPDLLEIRRSAHLAGGMAHKGCGKVVLLDAAAVIGDTDIGNTAVFDLDGDLLCPGVHCVFQQLLDDGSRTLHYLTGGNKLRYLRLQHMDSFGHGSFPSLMRITYAEMP